MDWRFQVAVKTYSKPTSTATSQIYINKNYSDATIDAEPLAPKKHDEIKKSLLSPHLAASEFKIHIWRTQREMMLVSDFNGFGLLSVVRLRCVLLSLSFSYPFRCFAYCCAFEPRALFFGIALFIRKNVNKM